ncbi:MAG: hypothetical protein DELT_00405 [Desulfovibrio sp.]
MEMIDSQDAGVNPEWNHIETYDLRGYDGLGRTKSFSQDELIEARKLVLDKLTEEDVERFTPQILVLENGKPKLGMIIHVIFDEAVRYNGNKSRNRTLVIENSKIVKEVEGRPRP